MTENLPNNRIIFIAVVSFIAGIIVSGLYCFLTTNLESERGITVFLDKDEYSTSEKPLLTILNGRRNKISLGVDYKIEELVNNTWMQIDVLNPNMVHFDDEIDIFPKGHYTESIGEIDYRPGHYRVIKSVYYNEVKMIMTFSIEFIVK